MGWPMRRPCHASNPCIALLFCLPLATPGSGAALADDETTEPTGYEATRFARTDMPVEVQRGPRSSALYADAAGVRGPRFDPTASSASSASSSRLRSRAGMSVMAA